MSTSILPTGGSTVLITQGGAPGIMLSGLTDALQSFRSKGAPNIAIIDDVAFVDQDITLPVVALDDKRVFYTFGKNFGQLMLTGTLYAGCGKPEFPAIKALQDAFDQLRVSSSKTPETLSIVGGFSCKVYIQQLEIMQAIPAVQSIKFRVTCTVVPPSNGG